MQPDYLFDMQPYTRSGVRVLPLRRSKRSAITPEVWNALLKVKDAIDHSGEGRRRRNMRGERE